MVGINLSVIHLKSPEEGKDENKMCLVANASLESFIHPRNILKVAF